jgi:hypothetical protein
MAVRVRYKANNKEFGALMRSDQTQDLADKGARAGVLEAQQIAMEAGLPEDYVNSIRAEIGPLAVYGGNPRRTARVVARHRLAGAFEFGTGRRRDRPQGGGSPTYRILGRAGAKIGSMPHGGTE